MSEAMTDERAAMILEVQAAALEGRISPVVREEVRRLCRENTELRKVVEAAREYHDSMGEGFWMECTGHRLEVALRELDEAKHD